MIVAILFIKRHLLHSLLKANVLCMYNIYEYQTFDLPKNIVALLLNVLYFSKEILVVLVFGKAKLLFSGSLNENKFNLMD